MTSEEEKEQARHAYEIVGELILIASALDYQLNHICIEALQLNESPMLETVVASVDVSRKIEILKAFADKMSNPGWKRRLKNHAEAVEKVNRMRNTAAHGNLLLRDGRAEIFSVATAKMLKSINLATKATERVSIHKLGEETRLAEKLLASGESLIRQLKQVRAELAAKKNACAR